MAFVGTHRDPAAPDAGTVPDTGTDTGTDTEALLLWVLAGSVVLRVLAVVAQHAFVYTDSIDYETLDLSGRARRPWVTPLLYHLVHDPAGRILLQGVIGGLCWAFLALQAGQLVGDRRVRWAVLVSVLALSLTTTVTNWDTAMLSESLALSCTALLLGTLLRYVRSPDLRAVWPVLVAWTLWIWTRQNNLVLALLGTGTVALVLAGRAIRRAPLERALLGLLVGLAAITALASFSYSRNTEIVHYNLAQIIGNRVLPDPGRTGWFVEQGMPLADGVVVGQPRSPQDLLADRAFHRWIDRDGIGVYGRYLARDPWRTITEPLDSFVSDRAPFGDLTRTDEVMLAGPDSYGVAREVLPSVVEDALFEPGQAGGVVLGLALVLSATAWCWRRHGPDPRWALPLVVLALQWPALTVAWQASTAELGRLALSSALLVRLALLLQAGLLVDAWLTRRAAPMTEPT
jgi:hypothetical protein